MLGIHGVIAVAQEGLPLKATPQDAKVPAWTDRASPVFVTALARAIQQRVPLGEYLYKANARGHQPTLRLPVQVEYYPRAKSSDTNAQWWNFALNACAAMDFELGSLGAWGPQCLFERVVHSPRGRLTAMSAAEQEGVVMGHMYTPAGLGMDQLKFILSNGEGRRVEVTIDFEVVKGQDHGAMPRHIEDQPTMRRSA